MNDTSREIENIQFNMIMALSPNERIASACEMFMAAREMIFSSMSSELTDKDRKKAYYFKMYGEPLPDDFFEDDRS